MNAFSLFLFSFLFSIDAYTRTGGWSCARVDLSTCVALAQLIKPSVTMCGRLRKGFKQIFFYIFVSLVF
ncbi:hypothetical protein, partial [Enterococcus columbae]|uniref:hypothetical protein n=1 Tax=Enterococcus columbae TaxID=1355 RepID=UPI001B7F94A5